MATNDKSQLPDVKSGDEYVPCEGCFKSFRRFTLRKYICPFMDRVSDARGVLQASQVLIPDVHPIANLRLRNLVLSIIQRGEIRDVVKVDETLIAYGNDLIDFHTKDQDIHMVSHNLRTLADIYRRVKATCPEIHQFSDIFKDRARAHNLSIAMQEMTGKNEKTGTIVKGNNIRDYSALLAKFIKFYKLYLVEKHATSLISEFEIFKVVLEGKFKLLNRQARNCLVEKAKYQPPQKIPKVSDIQRLCTYIQERHDESFEILIKGFNYLAYKTLNETALLLILLFNRKRQGEISRLLKNDLAPHCIYRLNDNCAGDEYTKLDEKSRATIQQYVRLAITNKKGLKNVDVIMHESLLRSINLILSYRECQETGIKKENKYVFAKASNNKHIDKHYIAWDILREYTKVCGVAEPELLGGTELRKQLATMMFGMKLQEESLKYLVNFMGHEYEIHKAYYRQRIPIQELSILAPLLEMAQGLTSRSTVSHHNANIQNTTQDAANSQEIANAQESIHKESHLDASKDADASIGSNYKPDSSYID
ncbi:uncharacterized protein LOC116738665 [Nasonia vitripennis]|uniref:Uncharacterized protein n=1 Tax=Nasonia vitripennis TaxID=7425 RepID=A0A7M7R1N3_NASVI|nr:uncharacterized protein LOC116738665 [Nasonia vitripennis]